MKTVKYQLRIKGLPSRDGTITVRAFIELLQQITSCAEKGLRLAIKGSSFKQGRPPAWLEKSTDIIFTGLENGSTVLDFEAPMIRDTIKDQIVQQDMWIKQPEGKDTAFSFISRIVKDTTKENLESDYFDSGVLTSLLEIKPFLLMRAPEVELISPERKRENFKLDITVIEKIEKLKIRLPEPRAFIISGYLDQIEHSQKRFQLKVNEKQTIQGKINEEFVSVEDLRKLWGKKVSVKGMVHFKPSQKVRFLDAQMLKPMTAGEEVFEAVPSVQTELGFMRELMVKEGKHDWLKGAWGKWPGNESIEELMTELESSGR